MASKNKKAEEKEKREDIRETLRIKELKCKTNKQKELVKSIRKNEITICSGSAGTGKAQPKSICIPTPNGFVKFGDLTVGDFVFDKNGKKTKITGIFEQGIIENYKVIFTDGRFTYCNGEHLWSFYNKKNKKLITKTLNEIKDMPLYRVDNRGHKDYIYQIPVNCAVEYDEREYTITPYVFGAFLGDGCCLNKKLTLSSSDIEIVERIFNDIDAYSYERESPKNYNWIFRFKETEGRGIKSIIQTYEFFKGFEDFIMQPSDKKHIPDIYKYGSVTQRQELLSGLFDTDGCVDTKGRIRYSTISKQLADDVKEICYSLGYIVTESTDIRENKYKNGVSYCLHIQCKLEEKLKLFHLQRKLNNIKIALSENKKRYQKKSIGIKSIEFVGMEDMRCIMVDNEEHLYLTNDYIVTHNTFVTLNTALRLLKEGYSKIILCKSVTSIPEEEIGFLKGNIEQKMEPFIMSYIGNLNKMIPEGMAETLFKEKVIEVLPLAYIRGLSIDNAVIILDECQNITMGIFKSVVTRIGENSKMVFLGDCEQVDFRTAVKRQQSALQHITKIFSDEDYVGVIEFGPEDCVRNPIIPKILERLRDFESNYLIQQQP